MNRAQRRQRTLGRAPLIVALPSPSKHKRRFTRNKQTTRLLELITIDGGRPEDSTPVVRMMTEFGMKVGYPVLSIDPQSPMLIARHKVTEQLLGFLSMKPIPPGKIYVENFHVVPGRLGMAAARALLDRLQNYDVKKVCIVHASNRAILKVLEHYGLAVIGYLLEGPMALDGAPEAAPAAQLVEAVS